jgi:hypothetical protein
MKTATVIYTDGRTLPSAQMGMFCVATDFVANAVSGGPKPVTAAAEALEVVVGLPLSGGWRSADLRVWRL